MGVIKNNHYIKSEDFLNEYNLSIKNNEPTNKLISYFEKIGKKYSTRYRTANKQDVDACVNYATFEAYRKWKSFDINVSTNIFAFFTQMIKNDMTIHYNSIFKNKDVNISIDALFTKNNEY